MKLSARVAAPVAVLTLLLVTASTDSYFRDEFYYLACTRHMAWGYVDHPPLSIGVLWAVRHLAGESLLAIRFVAAAVLAATILLTGNIARRLGGGSFAEAFAITAVAIAPAFLAQGSFYSMNVFDLLLWTAALRVFLECLESAEVAPWLALGILLGLGLLNKISMLWLAAGLAVALVLTPARRLLRTRKPYVTAVVATLIFLPHVIWQISSGWPTLVFIHNASVEKMQVNGPLAFIADQVKNLHPITLPIWGAGLVGLFIHPRLRRYRAIAIVFLTVASILIVNRTSRSGYLIPAYPAIMAAGAVMLESLVHRRAARAAMIVVLVLLGGITVPLAIPILRTDTYVRVAQALGAAPSTEEKKELGRLPQFFADRQGWNAFVGQVSAVWDTLSPSERAAAAVFAGNYGEAGAIERLRTDPAMVAISGHNNYWIWGPQGRTGQILVVLSRHPQRLQNMFSSVQLAGTTDSGDCMPYENHLGIYICRGMHPPLQKLWGELKHYE